MVFSQYGKAGTPGSPVQEPSVSQIIPSVPVKAAEHLMELAVPDSEQVSEPVVLTNQQFRLPVSVAVQQLVLHRFQPFFPFMTLASLFSMFKNP